MASDKKGLMDTNKKIGQDDITFIFLVKNEIIYLMQKKTDLFILYIHTFMN